MSPPQNSVLTGARWRVMGPKGKAELDTGDGTAKVAEAGC